MSFCPSEDTAEDGFIVLSESAGKLLRVHEVHRLADRLVRVTTHFGNGESHTSIDFEGLIRLESRNTGIRYAPRSDPGAMFPLAKGTEHELSFDVSAAGEPSYTTHRRYSVFKKTKVRLGPCAYDAFEIEEKGWNESDPYGPAAMGTHVYVPVLKLVVAIKIGRHGVVTAPGTLAPLTDLFAAIARLRAENGSQGN